jgi:hypothetical protein
MRSAQTATTLDKYEMTPKWTRGQLALIRQRRHCVSGHTEIGLYRLGMEKTRIPIDWGQVPTEMIHMRNAQKMKNFGVKTLITILCVNWGYTKEWRLNAGYKDN